jgi:hypothetical protein
MKRKEILLTANVLFSLGGIIGNSLWAASNNVFTLSSAYEFYWFVTVTSFLIGVGGMVYHSGKVQIVESVRKNLVYVFIVISVMYPIFWLAASASVASHLRDCLYIKKRLGNILDDDDYYFYGYRFNLKCDGEIISTSFGFANFIVWVLVLVAFFPYLRKKFEGVVITTTNTPTNINTVEMQETVTTGETVVNTETSVNVEN